MSNSLDQQADSSRVNASAKLNPDLDSSPGYAQRWGQAGLIACVWIFLVWLHADNDGLWFQGDAPRHAANGLFWLDYLRDFTFDAKGYALSYFARYPVINPVAWPPLFHILTAGAYSLFGPLPVVAKSLVLLFALTACLYTSSWIRRWIRPELGWTAVMLLLVPGIVTWSHAVMLNVPAVALTAGSLYHARRWLEGAESASRYSHFYLTAALGALAVLTYYPAGMILFVFLAWSAAKGTLWRLLRWRTAVFAFVCLLLFVPLVLIALRWAPKHVSFITRSVSQVGDLSSWIYYLPRLPQLFGPTLLTLAVAGWVTGLSRRRWRHETMLLTLWIAVTYATLSILFAKESRYALFLAPPLVCLGALALSEASNMLATFVRRPDFSTRISHGLALIVVGTLAIPAWRTPIPSVSGFRDVASYLKQVAPNEPVFYDGYYNGVFTFHVRAQDPDYRRQVILGNKLLYTYSLDPSARLSEFVSSADEVLEILRTQGGCRWLVIETSDPPLRGAIRFARGQALAEDSEVAGAHSGEPLEPGNQCVTPHREPLSTES